jgi:hypothetical protein
MSLGISLRERAEEFVRRVYPECDVHRSAVDDHWIVRFRVSPQQLMAERDAWFRKVFPRFERERPRHKHVSLSWGRRLNRR